MNGSCLQVKQHLHRIGSHKLFKKCIDTLMILSLRLPFSKATVAITPGTLTNCRAKFDIFQN